MAIENKLDYFTEAKRRLTQQFKGLPRIEGFLQAVSDECQELEDAMWEVFVNRVIQSDLATGDLLAKLGALVGQGSEGLTDAEYRLLIRARILANRSSGRREELITILSTLTGASSTIGFREYYPASAEIESDNVTISALLIFRAFLAVAKSAGVRLDFIYSKSLSADTFKFSSSYGGAVQTTTQRFGSTYSTPTGGGVLAGVFS